MSVQSPSDEPAHRLRLARIHPTDEGWRALDALPGRELFQTRAWIDFVAGSQQGEPVVAALLRGGRTVGCFTGVLVRRLGMRILGSPLPGWTTPRMGFTLTDEVCPAEAAEALSRFAFSELRCVHLELGDRHIGVHDLDNTPFEKSVGHTYELPLGSDDEIFGGFTSACRRAVRKAQKAGVVIEEAHGAAFADEYHQQLVGVFAHQGLEPTYGVDRIRHLITHLEPTGRLLLLRARNAEGRSIATMIVPGFGDTAYFFGGASVRSELAVRPNEALFWHAMRHWRDRGATTFDFGGGGDYKLRYGGTPVPTTLFHRSRIPGLSTVRPIVRTLAAHNARWRARPRPEESDRQPRGALPDGPPQ